MAETLIKKKLADPGQYDDVYTGTVDITISASNVTADSANITLDPAYSSAPKVTGLTFSVVRTGNAGATSVEVKTNSATVLAFTARVSTAPGGSDTTVITVRYTLTGPALAG